MTITQILHIIGHESFGDAFHTAINALYREAVERGEMGHTEDMYDAATKNLLYSFTAKKKVLLQQYEDVCQKICMFHATYGFLAGIYCGFNQYYTCDCDPDGGYFTSVVEQIDMIPNMQKHSENFAHIECRNKLSQQLRELEDEKTQAHICSVECAWAERTSSASVDSFLCGYHAAASITNLIAPSCYRNKKMNIKIMNIDTWLGYTHPIK